MSQASVWAHDGQEHNPYTFAVIVDGDPKTAEKAAKFIEYMKGLEPFSRMGDQLVFRVVESTVEKLDCRNNDPISERVIHCNKAETGKLGVSVGAHRTIVFTSKGSGGAGGSIPVASLDYSLPTMLHEIMHSYGFGDEYPYTVLSELKAFCKSPNPRLNRAIFEPLVYYASSNEAKVIHAGDFGWSGEIAKNTEITTGSSLGTAPGVYPEGTVGLFHAAMCEGPKTSDGKPKYAEWTPMHSWKPLNQNTIMNHDYAKPPVPPLYAKWVVSRMSSERGAPITLLDLKANEPGSVAKVSESTAKAQSKKTPGSGAQKKAPDKLAQPARRSID